MVDGATLAEAIAALLIALGSGGGVVHAYHRRRNGRAILSENGSRAQEEVLRQHLHDQRHGETLRILESVTTTTANAAEASKKAAEAAEKSARATGEIVAFINERHPKAPLHG